MFKSKVVTDTSAQTAKWRYVVPNAVTSMSLILGLGVVALASEGQFMLAGWLVVWCVLLDKLDGTCARLLGASSKFGAQLDSLADLVVFGVAPATTILFLTRAEPELFARWARFEWAIYAMLALFVVCASLRLAKFNVLAEDDDPPVFFGLPTTFTGGVLALLLLIGLDREISWLLGTLPLFAMAFALLMVANFVLPKIGHSTSTLGMVAQVILVGLAYVFGFMRVFPGYLLAVSVGFAAFGMVFGLLHRDELLATGTLEGDTDSHDELDLEPQPG